ncbi:MAG: yrrB 8, partial [Pseudonocardiales bacterium]|nr:yrrB 8 [Pseudonocardiales bacterium]
EAHWIIAERGETYRLMDHHEQALTDFNQIIELNPQDQWAIASRAETYRRMGRYDEALTDFNQAIALWPEEEWTIAERGESTQSSTSDSMGDR